MAVLFKPKEQASHWYTASGEPMHTVKDAKGLERSTDLRDARKLGLLPSVTNVCGVVAKYGLENWKVNQAILATLANSMQPDEPLEYYCKRIQSVAQEQTEEAATLGTRIHDAIDKAITGEPYADDLRVYVEPTVQLVNSKLVQVEERELVVVSRSGGYAGRMDACGTLLDRNCGCVVDYKSTKSEPGKKMTGWPEHAWQLAAYGRAHYGPRPFIGASVYISTTEPGRVEWVERDSEEMREAFTTFELIAALWFRLKKYDPRKR